MSWLVIIVSLLGTGFTLTALWRLRPAPGSVRREGRRPPVLLIRPVDAPTGRELQNLALPTGYEGALQQVVVSPFRPRLPPGVRWLPSDPLTANRKVGHVVYALETLRPRNRRVLVIDADVAVDAKLIDALVAELDGGAALASAPPSPFGGRGPGARAFAALLTQTHHSFFALDAMRAGAPAVCGKAIALSKVAQGELRTLGDHVGEDLELADRLHRRGRRVTLAAQPAFSPQSEVSLGESHARATRWMQVLRAHRPGLYPAVPLLFAPTPLLALGSVAVGPSTLTLGLFVALILARTALSLRLTHAHRIEVPLLQRATFWFVGETLLLAAFVTSLGARTVRWRGRSFELAPGGTMRPAPVRLEVRAA